MTQSGWEHLNKSFQRNPRDALAATTNAGPSDSVEPALLSFLAFPFDAFSLKSISSRERVVKSCWKTLPARPSSQSVYLGGWSSQLHICRNPTLESVSSPQQHRHHSKEDWVKDSANDIGSRESERVSGESNAITIQTSYLATVWGGSVHLQRSDSITFSSLSPTGTATTTTTMLGNKRSVKLLRFPSSENNIISSPHAFVPTIFPSRSL